MWQGIVISLLDGTYSAFLVPISIAFSSDLNHWSWSTIVDVIAGDPPSPALAKLHAANALPGLLCPAQHGMACAPAPLQSSLQCMHAHRLSAAACASSTLASSPVVAWLPLAVTLRAHHVAGFLFTLDIVLLFHTGFLITCNLRKRLVMDGYFVACYYVKHASLVIDVLATVPAWIEVRLPPQALILDLTCKHTQRVGPSAQHEQPKEQALNVPAAHLLTDPQWSQPCICF